MTEDAFEAHWTALNEHLGEVRPIFDCFCERHEFEYLPRTAIGRYPRIRIQRVRETTVYFDLWMELDANGSRFEHFRRDLPYALFAGAHVVVNDGSKYGVRFQQGITCFSGKPFDQVGAV